MQKRILIIEDDPIIRECLAALFDAEGYAILESADGRTGALLYMQQSPDLVITDLHMPGMDGVQVIKTIRGHATQQVPILAMTADPSPALKRQCETAGIDGYLLKPFDPDALLATAAGLLQTPGIYA